MSGQGTVDLTLTSEDEQPPKKKRNTGKKRNKARRKAAKKKKNTDGTNRARNWCGTWNNYGELSEEQLKSVDYKYLIYGREGKAEGKTPHLQIYIEFKKKVSMRQLKKMLGDQPHWEKRKAPTSKAAADYCKKEDKEFFEDGVQSNPGKRTDLIEMKDAIMEGKLTVKDIVLDTPNAYHQYGRTIEKIMMYKKADIFRTEMTKGFWIYGPTGTGKTHMALNHWGKYHPSTHYMWRENDGIWQDLYHGQEVVIIEDTRGAIKYDEMLKLCDNSDYRVPRRNCAPEPFMPKFLIVTSSLAPHEAYNRRAQSDNIAQLLRRFTVIHKTEVYEPPIEVDEELEGWKDALIGTTPDPSDGESVATIRYPSCECEPGEKSEKCDFCKENEI